MDGKLNITFELIWGMDGSCTRHFLPSPFAAASATRQL